MLRMVPTVRTIPTDDNLTCVNVSKTTQIKGKLSNSLSTITKNLKWLSTIYLKLKICMIVQKNRVEIDILDFLCWHNFLQNLLLLGFTVQYNEMMTSCHVVLFWQYFLFLYNKNDVKVVCRLHQVKLLYQLFQSITSSGIRMCMCTEDWRLTVLTLDSLGLTIWCWLPADAGIPSLRC